MSLRRSSFSSIEVAHEADDGGHVEVHLGWQSHEPTTLIVRESEEENKMKIKLNPELIAKVMMTLRQRGEDPNDYFEMEVDTGTTLVEGQTRLTEFMQPDETPVEHTVPAVIRVYIEPNGKTVYKIDGLPDFKGDDLHEAITEVERQKAIDGMRKYVKDGLVKPKKGKKVKKGKKGTKASKSKKRLTPKESKETWDNAVAERLASLLEGEDTFRRIIAMCPHPHKEVDFKKAAKMLHNASTDKSIWLTKVKRNPSGTAVRSVYTWLQRNQRTKIKNKIKVRKNVDSNKHLYNEDNPWNPAEIDWMQSNYGKLRGWNQSNKIIAGLMFDDEVSKTKRKAWEVRDMAKNLGLN